MQADESKDGAKQATDNEEHKATRYPVGQVRKPARASESADAQTRYEDRNRDKHADIVVGAPDGFLRTAERIQRRFRETRQASCQQSSRGAENLNSLSARGFRV